MHLCRYFVELTFLFRLWKKYRIKEIQINSKIFPSPIKLVLFLLSEFLYRIFSSNIQKTKKKHGSFPNSHCLAQLIKNSTNIECKNDVKLLKTHKTPWNYVECTLQKFHFILFSFGSFHPTHTKKERL